MSKTLPRDYYYQKSLDFLSKIEKSSAKPRLLLHVCCGPCSCYPLTFLCPHFDVTIYYANSNIYPRSEFDHRLETLRELLKDLKRDHGFEIGLIVPPYDNASFMQDLAPYKDEPEGGKRCHVCYEKRMREAYDYAGENGFDAFCTVMTISPQKDSRVLNEIGERLAKEHPSCPYFFSDFKKKDGALKGLKIKKAYGLYSQDYCGCIYSLNNRRKASEETDSDDQLIG